jgi:type 1 glutamine amidotransferase
MFGWIDRALTISLFTVCLLSASLPGGTSGDEVSRAPATTLIRVLVLSGQGDHDWRSTTPFLRRVLTGTGRFDVRVCEVPSSLTPLALAGFDVLVLVYDSAVVPLDAFVASGKGIVLIHSKRASDSAVRAQFLQVRMTRPEHPVLRGMDGGFRIADALHRGITIPAGAEVIAEASAIDLGKGGTAPDAQPVLFAHGHGKGRIFGTTLGHDLAAMHQPEFIATFLRGVEWAATGDVTLPVDIGMPRPARDAVRGLVITGGHDHLTSFYTLFEGYKDLARMPVASSKEAFQSDLRRKYDVLIMYDFSRDLDETGKKNLRDFVESGKGVVVLHHALLNYQDWPWWFEEVVGGRYRLKRDGDSPSSSVKDGQLIAVTSARAHPVTAGIGPFQFVDETYKGMWLSPRIRPLLETDNPNSDPVVGWIGPCRTSRVVAIQLGHGPAAFDHPSYRSLVHRAILWSAGRVE